MAYHGLVVGFRSSRLAYAALLLMAILWGSTLVVMKGAYARMDPASLLVDRYLVSAITFGVFFPKAWKASRSTIAKGVVLGLLFSAGQLLQALGLERTSAAVNGFIAGLYVVVTPLLAALFLGKKVNRQVWIAVALATIGLGSLALNPASLGSGIGIGELLTFASAVVFAGHILLTGKVATPNNVISLGLYQTLTVTLVCTLFAAPGGIVAPTTVSDWTAVCYLGIVCGTLTILLQSWAQTRVDATRSAVVMCTEPLWGAAFAVGIAGEVVTGQMVFGALTILAAMVLVIRPAGRRRGATDRLAPSPAPRPEPSVKAPHVALDRYL